MPPPDVVATTLVSFNVALASGLVLFCGLHVFKALHFFKESMLAVAT